MIDFVLFCIVTSFWCLGIFNARDYILSTPSAWMELNLPRWITEPLIGCIYCMASAHSVIVYSLALLSGLIDLSPLVVLLAIPCVSYLNGIIYTIIWDND